MRLSQQTEKTQQLEVLREELKAIQQDSNLSREDKAALVEAKRAEIFAVIEKLGAVE